MGNAMAGYICPIDPDELAGLACEIDVESRLVLEQTPGVWDLRPGPFSVETFTGLGDSHWTLLVQDVDKHVPEVAPLLDYFRFIPDWRIDDIMISYAADQGSVGPHTDQYDVFLVQVQGKRRWRIGTSSPDDAPLRDDTDLKVLAEFSPESEWLLEPGDVLYLPPGVAHWGVAEDACMTCSVGFRAPSMRELAGAWFEFLSLRVAPEHHYKDVVRSPQECSAEITTATLSDIRRLLNQVNDVDDVESRRWFGRFITETKEHLVPATPDQALDPTQLHARFRRYGIAYRHPFTRAAFAHADDSSVDLFINGESFTLSSRYRDFVASLAHSRELHFGDISAWLDASACRDLLSKLYNSGYLVFRDD